jgi:4-hydroxy-4-methyl-2-oxoglutarate aldolase
MSLPDSFSTLREKLYSAVISDALDAAGFRQQCLAVSLLPMTGGLKLMGRCRTTLWEDIDFEDPEPYKIELEAVDALMPDDVLIAAAGGSMRSGIWGELLSTAARNRGCVGAIVHGAVRDVAPMREMGFAVFASGVCPYDSLHRQRVIARDEPVEIGGVTIRSGDVIFADEDGVVVVPQEVEARVLQAAWEKVHAENAVRDDIRSGMAAAEVFAKYGIL